MTIAPPTRARAAALGLLGVGVLGLAVAFVATASSLDLSVYLAGGHAYLVGVPLYGPDVQVQHYGFTYPPFAALLFAPAGLLPRPLAVAGMAAASVAAALYLLESSQPGTLRRAARHWPAALAVLAVLGCEPVRVTLWNGQVNLLLAALLLLDLRAAPGGRFRGLASGLAAAIKLTPAIVLLYYLLEGDRRAARNLVLGFAGCTAFALLVDRADSVSFWRDNLMNRGNLGDIARGGNQSLRAVLERALGDGPALTPLWLGLALATVCLAVVAVRTLLAAGERLAAFTATCITGCLISPVSWTHHWIWCVPLVACVARTSLLRSARARLLAAALAVEFGFGCNKQPLRLADHWTPSRLLAENLYVLTGLALLVAVAVAGPLSRRRRRLPPEPLPAAPPRSVPAPARR